MKGKTGISRGLLMLSLAILCAALSTSCGGGGGGQSGNPGPSGESVQIFSPTDTGVYQTDQPTVALEGSSFAPAGSSCPAIEGVLPPGYEVTCSNTSTGSSGYVSFYLNCLIQVSVIWNTQISLAMGANSITVTATDAAGHSGRSTIVVTRVPDTTPPTIVSVSPVNGATGVGVNTGVAVTFSEAMDPSTINVTTILLKDAGNNPVPATVSYGWPPQSATLTPVSLLAFNTTYQVTVTTGVKDSMGGNALAMPYTFSFTTGSNPDKTPPNVQSVDPASGTYCASTTGTVTATFSEDLDPTTVNTGTFLLTGAGNQTVSGSVSYANGTATFVPAAALAAGGLFTGTLTTGIRDLAGNALASPFSWNFSTAPSQGVGTWTPTSFAGALYARYGHVAVWTGSEMIIAGGTAWDSDWNVFQATDQYGRYNPTTGTWTLATGAPASAGDWQKAVWTGSRMLVWGGYIGGSFGGAAFDPGTNAWTPIATAGQPAERYDYTAVWTGSEMIVWGGQNGYGQGLIYGDGAKYNPTSNTWLPVSTTGAPTARHGHTAVWTGSEMIVWGGVSGSLIFNDGARYNPSTDTWTPLSTTNAPTARYGHIAVWTGTEMIVWGEEYGGTNSGGLYDPATDSWRAMETLCAPSGRGHTSAIWTGRRMIVWGGSTLISYFADGAEYDPVGNIWARLTATAAPIARAYHTAVWTGNEMIIWGGAGGGPLNSGGVFTP